jgi:RimJ/RimL family protein N-acetyltransferase
MLKAALAEAEAKFEVVYLSVFASNVRAQQLYERFGFRVCGHLPRAVKRGGQYFDEVRMVRLFDRTTTGSGPTVIKRPERS